MDASEAVKKNLSLKILRCGLVVFKVCALDYYGLCMRIFCFHSVAFLLTELLA